MSYMSLHSLFPRKGVSLVTGVYLTSSAVSVTLLAFDKMAGVNKGVVTLNILDG